MNKRLLGVASTLQTINTNDPQSLFEEFWRAQLIDQLFAFVAFCYSHVIPAVKKVMIGQFFMVV